MIKLFLKKIEFQTNHTMSKNSQQVWISRTIIYDKNWRSKNSFLETELSKHVQDVSTFIKISKILSPASPPSWRWDTRLVQSHISSQSSPFKATSLFWNREHFLRGYIYGGLYRRWSISWNTRVRFVSWSFPEGFVIKRGDRIPIHRGRFSWCTLQSA